MPANGRWDLIRRLKVMEAFSTGERGLSAHWIESCMGPRLSVDAMVNKSLLLLWIELQIPARSVVRIPTAQQLSFKYKNLVKMKFSDKLTFLLPGWYFSFHACLMKTWVLFGQKKTKLWNKQHFVENKTEIMPSILKMAVNIVVAEYI